MALGRFSVVLAIGFYIFLGEAYSAEPHYVSSGGSVTLRPATMAGTPTDILWTHNKNKVVEWDPTAEPVYREYNKFIGSVKLNPTTGELTIRGLTTALSGSYEIEYTIDNKLHLHDESVIVLDPASQPEIRCERFNNNTMLTLCCSSQGSGLQYRWSGPGLSKEQQESVNITTTEEGVYTCEVKNPVSQEWRSFNTISECAKKEGNQPTNSKGVSTGTSNPIGVAVGVAVVATLVIGLVIGLVVYLKRRECRNNKKRSSVTELRTRDEASPLLQKTPMNDQHTKDNDNNGQSAPEIKGTRNLVGLYEHLASPTNITQNDPPLTKPLRLPQYESNGNKTTENLNEGGEEGKGRDEQIDEGRDDCREAEGSGRVDTGGEAEGEGMVSKDGQVTNNAGELGEVQVMPGRGEGAEQEEGSERRDGTEDTAGGPWLGSEETMSGSAPGSPSTRVPCPSTTAASEEGIGKEQENPVEGRQDGDRTEQATSATDLPENVPPKKDSETFSSSIHQPSTTTSGTDPPPREELSSSPSLPDTSMNVQPTNDSDNNGQSTSEIKGTRNLANFYEQNTTPQTKRPRLSQYGSKKGTEQHDGTEDTAGGPCLASEETMSGSAPGSPSTRAPCPSTTAASEERIGKEQENPVEGRQDEDRTKQATSGTDLPENVPLTKDSETFSSFIHQPSTTTSGTDPPPREEQSSLPFLPYTSINVPPTKDNDNNGQSTSKINGTRGSFLDLESEGRDDTAAGDTPVLEGTTNVPQKRPPTPPPKPNRPGNTTETCPSGTDPSTPVARGGDQSSSPLLPDTSIDDHMDVSGEEQIREEQGNTVEGRQSQEEYRTEKGGEDEENEEG